jgi:polyisoprenyl-phosphate glycosyltransferase
MLVKTSLLKLREMSRPELSIVVPVYRSEKILPNLHARVTKSLEHFDFELILVNDKSPDKSWEVIRQLAGSDPRVKGISLKKNEGQDNAIMAGLSKARGAYVVVMDDDLQHSPSDIPKLLHQCQAGFDVCYGLFVEKKQTFWKNIGSALNDLLAQLFLKKPKDLYLSPFKLMRASVVEQVNHYSGPFPYLDGIILAVTSSLTQIELEHHKRADGKGNYNLIKSISVFLKHVTGYSLYPLRLVTIIGIFAASLSFLLGAYFTVDYVTTERRVEGWTSLVLLIVFFNGLILMCLGLIGEYIGRIYLTVTSKPQYVIDETTGDLAS